MLLQKFSTLLILCHKNKIQSIKSKQFLTEYNQVIL